MAGSGRRGSGPTQPGQDLRVSVCAFAVRSSGHGVRPGSGTEAARGSYLAYQRTPREQELETTRSTGGFKMSSNLVIVALPEDSDPVRKVSSEKEPHLTLLFLGDVDSNPNIDRIFAFVGHAVNIAQHGEFYLDVDYRGILGSDKADVIHFRKSWNYAWVNQFRNQL